MAVSTVDYLNKLQEKGFHFQDDSLGFIKFGKVYTESPDSLVNVAIEITLKAQLQFDGSFFIALLEVFKAHNVSTKKQAYQLIKQKKIL
ncbi:DUF6123 family protein [Bacillus sp. Marseille-P3661]|uniref:DUF6123 family protein n=1 Tax=Bacillus sp. Marseille-P3661 TaxID=1936234 RepID=UPI0027E5AD90|nr:DUF6123 family protein [Bacillus sp. Marseille-P3661]